ncbi:hypothetical protein LJC26_06370 [Desulfovibrio sp. OttesenSCG-928-O18]|nr:hypothetical protein [Desulfovibrio sp. OttesenSCG-928-O18]
MQQTESPGQLPAKLSVGGVLSRSWRTLMRAPAVFCGLAAASSLSAFLLDYFSVAENAVDTPESLGVDLLLVFLGFVFISIVQAVVAYEVFRVLDGAEPSFVPPIARGLACIAPVAVLAALYMSGILLGLILLVIPGFILVCMWEVALPACVAENLGPIASLKRSAALTKGCRMQIFGLFIGTMLPYLLLAALGSTLLAEAIDDFWIRSVIGNMAAIPAFAYFSVMMGTIYYDLRTMKEGAAISGMARVFS